MRGEKMKAKIVLVVCILALLLSACDGYNILSMPDDTECSAAGYDVYTPLVSIQQYAACKADALDNGQLDNSQ